MYLSTAVLLLTIAATFEGIRGSILPYDSLNGTVKNFKRQSLGCRPASALQVDSQCLEIFDRVLDLYTSLTTINTQSLSSAQSSLNNVQSSLNEVFQIFCDPECGNALLSQYDACGVFDFSPALKDFYSGLCGTNNHGDSCYEHYVRSIATIVRGLSCSSRNKYSSTCTCKSELESSTGEIGCCLSVYEDYFSGFGFNVNKALYAECDVDAPENCNNSPIRVLEQSNSSAPFGFNIIIYLIQVLGFYTLLG